MHEPASTSLPLSSWAHIDRLREAARLLIKAVEVESGPQSAHLARCASLWHHAEREAAVSLPYSDFKNAAVRLDQALRVLSAPGVARRAGPGADGLPEAEVGQPGDPLGAVRPAGREAQGD